MGDFRLRVGDAALTEHEDIWSQTIRDTVLVSAYPLAQWVASSWWRLRYEPLPPAGIAPTVEWRMAHELTAANEGFLWPWVIFASDTESMQLWSVASRAVADQSVRYVRGLDQPRRVSFAEFEDVLKRFIGSVLSRLDAVKLSDTPLKHLWQEVQEEIADEASSRYRRCEAELGFDPDECPEALVEDALALARRMGSATFSEVAPHFGRGLSAGKPLSETVAELIQNPGPRGKPQVSVGDADGSSGKSAIPWQRANDLAHRLRRSLDCPEHPLTDDRLYELLGLRRADYESWAPPGRSPVSLAVPSRGAFCFHPRKRHPVARRFELARFIGDYLAYGEGGASWLANSDLRTSRQRFQRAFAAELLCPLVGLTAFLEGDYSEGAIEDAAMHFDVSPLTVGSILANNGLVSPAQSASYLEAGLPY